MNFLEAVAEMRKGKKVRRKSFGNPDAFYYINFDYAYPQVVSWENKNSAPNLPSVDNFMATDWEVVEENKDWNLVQQKTSFYYDGVHHPCVLIDDVKKCRDLIIKDVLKKFGLMKSDSEWIKIIEKRFGDLE